MFSREPCFKFADLDLANALTGEELQPVADPVRALLPDVTFNAIEDVPDAETALRGAVARQFLVGAVAVLDAAAAGPALAIQDPGW